MLTLSGIQAQRKGRVLTNTMNGLEYFQSKAAIEGLLCALEFLVELVNLLLVFVTTNTD